MPLGELIGQARTRRAGSGEFPLLSMTMHHGLVPQESKFKKRVASIDVSDYKVILRGQLVVGFPIDEGVLDFQSQFHEAIVSPAYGVWDLKAPNMVDRPYLQRFLRSPRAMAYYKAKLRGSTARRRSLPSAVFLALPVPIPSVEEQRRIAAILDKADAIRAKRRQVLAHLDSLTQSIFHDMFGDDPATSAVAEIALKVRTGPFGSQLLHGEFVGEGIAVLGLDNVVRNEFLWAERRYVTPEKYEQLKRYTVHPGDVLISIMGTTGRCVVVPEDIPTAINTKHICAITPDTAKLLPAFLRAAFLWHPEARAHLRRQTKGSIMDGLNMGIIRAMPVPVPSLDRQHEFHRHTVQVDAQRSAVQVASRTDDQLFESLQSRAFRGEL